MLKELNLDLDIRRYKVDFNYCLGRYKKAEEYFSSHKPSECERYTKAFNGVVSDLSRLKKVLSVLMDRELTESELNSGFEEVKIE